MIFQQTQLSGAYIIDIEKIEDERGFFAEGWKKQAAEAHGVIGDFNRANVSHNKKAGTVRGLHAQKAPFAEAKLVRCTQGAIFDVMVDLRPESPTYRHWVGVELTSENHRMLYIPQGFLHGFQTLVNDTTVFYQVAGEYTPQAEIGALYHDPAFGIEWPYAEERTISEKDQRWAPFNP